jgi:hypothetical protein
MLLLLHQDLQVYLSTKIKPTVNKNYKKKGKFRVFSSSEIYNFCDFENLVYYENNDTINIKNKEIIKQI